MKAFAIALIAVLLSSAVAFAQHSAQAAPQAQKSNTQKLLMDSIQKLDVAGVKTTLEKGANPNCASSAESPISTSVISGVHSEDYSPESAEQKAVEILQMLFKAGAKLQSCDIAGGLLYVPISEGRALLTEVLLNNGASPTTNIDRETLMEIAVGKGQANIIGLLKKHGEPTLEPREAAQQRLIGAAGDHDIPGMEDAIDDGADVNGSNRQGQTALIAACQFFWGEAWQTPPILYLLKKGADPRTQGSDDAKYPWFKTTALHSVMVFSARVFEEKNQKENERLKGDAVRVKAVIEALLQHGALVSARDSDGKTPLHIAAKKNNIVGARMLIDAGCKIMPLDRTGKTPLDYAESAEMIKLLKDHGAKEQ
jgi:ankyrin repeat protein